MVREKISQGPRVWNDLNSKADSKINAYLEKNEERTTWLSTYLEGCRKKLGGVSNNPSFVNKTPGTPANNRTRVGKTSETKEIVVEKKSRRSSRKKSSLNKSADRTNDYILEVEKKDEIRKAKICKSSRKSSVSRNDQGDFMADFNSSKKSPCPHYNAQLKDQDELVATVEEDEAKGKETVDRDEAKGKGAAYGEEATDGQVEIIDNSRKTSGKISAVEQTDEVRVDTADAVLPKDKTSTDVKGSKDDYSVDESRILEFTFDVGRGDVDSEANMLDNLVPGLSSNTTESFAFIEAEIVVQEQEDPEEVDSEVEATEREAAEQRATDEEATGQEIEDQDNSVRKSAISGSPINNLSPVELIPTEKSDEAGTFEESDTEMRETTNVVSSIVDCVETSNNRDMAGTFEESDTEMRETTNVVSSIVDCVEASNNGDMTEEEKSIQDYEQNSINRKSVDEYSRSDEDKGVVREDANPKVDENIHNSKDVDEADHNISLRSSKTLTKATVSTSDYGQDIRPKRSTRTKPKKLQSPQSDSHMAGKTTSMASPRVKQIVRAMSPSIKMSSTMDPIFTGSPIKDRVKMYEEVMSDSAGLKKTLSSKFKTASSRTPRSRGRKSSVAKSLMKVSAARDVHLTEILAEQEVNVIVGKSLGMKSPGERQSLNNSRAPVGKEVRPGRKVYASGGRGITTPGSSSGSSSLIRNRSRLNLGTPSNNSSNEAQKDEERRKQADKENEARQRREEMLKSKTEKQRENREARNKRVQEARKKRENPNWDKVRKNKENVDKLAILKKREENLKAQAKKLKEAEDQQKETALRRKVEEENRGNEKRQEEERKKIKQRKEEEERKQMKLKEQEERKQQLARKAFEEKEQQITEQERILREKEELNKIKKSPTLKRLRQDNLDSTYSKENSLDKTQILDSTSSKACQGVTSYDMTPARHELPPEPLKNEDDYGLEDLNSDQDTDDEEAPRKQIPKWADATSLRTALFKQCYMGPNIDEIFMTIIMPDLSEMFKQQRKRFFKRTSSACWDQAPTSFKVTRS